MTTRLEFSGKRGWRGLWLLAVALVIGCGSDGARRKTEQLRCESGQTACGAECVDVDTDPNHCGGCGVACGEGRSCVAGECGCPATQVDCQGVCVDTSQDPLHCGACDVACASPSVCSLGACADRCAAGLTDCGGACVDTGTSPAHCGGCDRACLADQSCATGNCVSECPSGTLGCDGACADTSTDEQHCGSCTVACGVDETCVAGVCELACTSGTACGGACVDTQANAAHCGGCDQPCPTGQVCAAGSCATQCPDGFTDCSGGCVDLQNDPAHCGSCTNDCGTLACAQGACTRCDLAGTITDLPALVPGSFDGAASRIEPSCGISDTAEQVYSFTAPSEGSYVIGAPGFDVLIATFNGCDGSELTCEAEAGRYSSTLVLAAGQTITIVVESTASTPGTFELRVQQPEANPCCEPSSTPGCGDPEIEACVCAVGSGCCTLEWNEACIALVNREGCGFCELPRPPMCGSEACDEFSAAAKFYGVSQCCTTTNECGASFGGACVERDQPGLRDAACPAEQVGGIRAQGCCRPDGSCGLDLSVLGMGCVSREDAPGASFTPIQCGPTGGDFPTFVNFESDQVRPLALSPDGTRLFAVNTPDARLEVFDIQGNALVPLSSIPVGMEPVAVAARSNTEVWVVNQLSDSVSIVDFATVPPHVSRTLLVGDEPRDIVFGGPGSSRAFITTAHRGQSHPVDPQSLVPGVGRADVWVFDAQNLGTAEGGTPITIVNLFGDTPRALAVTPDGATVFAAVFHSGNQTTTVSESFIGPGELPPPHENFEGITQPETGLIVRFDGANWIDELGRPWDSAVQFSLPDYDVFAIDANATPPVMTTRHSGVGTTLFNMAVNPVTGAVYVTNTEARNEVRFEPTIKGHFAENRVTVIQGTTVTPRHLNPHIDFSSFPGGVAERSLSLAQPTGIAVSADGSQLFIAALGSGKVAIVDAAALESGTYAPEAANQVTLSGRGPTGVALDEARSRLYVMTRFDNGISVVDTATKGEVAHARLFSPEPAEVVDGRRFMYDAAFSSSHGDSACSGCHIFSDTDHLAWDLGDPTAPVVSDPNPGGGGTFHPMKGPMATQSLRGLQNHGTLHWRGDRTSAGDVGGDFQDVIANFHKFNAAFVGLLGRETQLTTAEMQQFAEFVMTITYPPNPHRALDNSLTTTQKAARDVFFNRSTDIISTCNGCHTSDLENGFFGTDGTSSFDLEPQIFKIPHFRNLYQKVGMFGMSSVLGIPGTAFMGDQIRGFGYTHDGAVDTLVSFLQAGIFNLSAEEEQNMAEFLLAFDSNMAPVVGQQITVTPAEAATTPVRLGLLAQRAIVAVPRRECDLIGKGTVEGEVRGFLVQADRTFLSDRASDPARSVTDLLALLTDPGESLTFTCVPPGSGLRAGLDRDLDGKLDRDEIDAGTDPANPAQ